MQEHTETISSLDKVLSHLEQDMNDPEKEELLEDLIDVHTLLTTIKVKHIQKTENSKTLSESLHLYAYMAVQSFKVVFGGWESYTKVLDDRVLLYNDLIYLDINRDEGCLECIISFFHKASPIVVAEVINTLKEIFGIGLKVSNEVFVVDEATGKYIWGIDAINQYIHNMNGKKIKPIIYFDGETVGNS